jgi:hypothetical protein
VAILIAARCNVWEVSEWAGHNSVAFTLTRLDARLGGSFKPSDNVLELKHMAKSMSPESPGADSGGHA